MFCVLKEQEEEDYRKWLKGSKDKCSDKSLENKMVSIEFFNLSFCVVIPIKISFFSPGLKKYLHDYEEVKNKKIKISS